MTNKSAKYYYDKKSLSYKKISNKENVFFLILKYSLTSLIIASIMTFIIFSFVDSPKEKTLKREIQNLELQYISMEQQMNNIELVLDDIQKSLTRNTPGLKPTARKDLEENSSILEIPDFPLQTPVHVVISLHNNQ